MVSADGLLGFALASFILIAIPGPSVLFVVGRALAHGRATALATVAGNAVGVYVVAACVAHGVVFHLVKTAGALYLVWLGIQAIRHRRDSSAVAAGGHVPQSRWRAARQGFVVGVANPKAFIIFAAVLPQFVDASVGPVPLQMLLLSCVAFVIALASDSVWAITASSVRSWFEGSARRSEMVAGVGGLSMVGLGISIAVTGRKD
jgi:threonine/homoserine/homoserine lactone efflux protein